MKMIIFVKNKLIKKFYFFLNNKKTMNELIRRRKRLTELEV